MPSEFTYSVASDTANAAIAIEKLHDEISASSITISLQGVALSGDVITVTFQADISTAEETTLDGLVSAHDGIPGPNDPAEVHVSGSPPFADKTIPGYKLYRRVHGETATLAASGTTTIDFTVPYTLCKIDEIQMYWFPEGVTLDFTVRHPIAGEVSKHGYGVPVAADYGEDASSYDATLQAGLILRLEFTNSTATTKTIGAAFVLHEMEAL